MKTDVIKNIFRIIALLEGISYILLLIAVPIKYLANNEQYVKALGMPHGILFILYIGVALIIRKKRNWSQKDMILIMLGSIIPFGTFYIDYKYLK